MDIGTIELFKLGFVGLLLLAAAAVDWRKREVPPHFAYAIAIVGGSVSAYEYLGAHGPGFVPVLVALASLSLFYGAGKVSAMLPQHFFGGGDAKLMMALSLAAPFPPIWSLDHGVVFWTPAFPLTVFVNTVVISLPLFLIFRKDGVFDVPFLVPLFIAFPFSIACGDAFINLLADFVH